MNSYKASRNTIGLKNLTSNGVSPDFMRLYLSVIPKEPSLMGASFFLDFLLWNICRFGHNDVVWFLGPGPSTAFIQHKLLDIPCYSISAGYWLLAIFSQVCHYYIHWFSLNLAYRRSLSSEDLKQGHLIALLKHRRPIQILLVFCTIL